MKILTVDIGTGTQDFFLYDSNLDIDGFKLVLPSPTMMVHRRLKRMLPTRSPILLVYREQMLDKISMLFGGRVAEELFTGDISTGASNDFERATQMARDMVTRYGMSDLMGPMVYAENEGEVFLGRSVTTHKNISEATMQKVDSEIRRILDEQYALAKKILTDNRDKVEAMTAALLEYETIDADQIGDIMAGRPARPPKPAATPHPPAGGDKPSSPAPTAQPAQET